MLADVAVSLTPMAIIAQHVPVPGCWVAEVLRWKVPLPESAERQVAESAQMFLCGTWTSLEDARIHGGAQLAVDTTLVSALHGDGRPRRGASERDGVALLAEFLGVRCRARLVVLAVEVGGRFSRETSGFISEVARARARSKTALMRKRAEQAWRMRWCGLFGCAAAKAFAASLLELQGSVGADGDTLSHEVEGDFRHAGLAA